MDEISFTDKKFWRQLEALSLHYITSRINYAIPSTAELTPERKDGGFDGKIVINITDDSSVKHCILFESKFRTTIETLPLDDCSKALIIAFNRAAQTLFIVTNILFSDQAKKEIDNFKRKINLNVIEVDGIELKRYVKDNYLELNKICSEEFLQYILNVSSKSLNLKMDCHTALNQNRKIYSNDFQKKEEYICKNHKFYTALHQTEMAIQSGNAYIVLRGDGGIGKTVLLNEACQILQNKGYSISTFQLRDYPSPRLLFIQLLGSLWNINLNEFIIRNSENSFLELIEMTQEGHIEQDLSDAVTRAIYSGSEKDCGFADNYHYLLVKFLYRILRPYKSFCKIIWCFSDLNKSTIDTLDFLSALFNKLIGIIPIIVEVKPEFTLDTVPSNLIRKNYYKTFCLTSEYTHIVDIKGFDVDDAKTYLLHFLPGMTEEQVYLIIEKTGVLPLYLNIIATYISMMIKRLDIKPEFLPNYVLLNILQSFKQQENTLILESLRVYCEDPQIARCFAITGLLDGRLPLVLMEKLYDSSEVENLYNKLDNDLGDKRYSF